MKLIERVATGHASETENNRKTKQDFSEKN